MKSLIRILFITILIVVSIGYYYKNTGDHPVGDIWVGLGVLAASFILMPLFIYYRWRDRKVKDYMLTEENIKKMKDFSQSKK